MFGKPHEERKVELGAKGGREDISPGDVDDRLDLDPEEQPNLTDPERSDPQQTDPPGSHRGEGPTGRAPGQAPGHPPKHRADVPEER
jgi:hypothetical protein